MQGPTTEEILKTMDPIAWAFYLEKKQRIEEANFPDVDEDEVLNSGDYIP